MSLASEAEQEATHQAQASLQEPVPAIMNVCCQAQATGREGAYAGKQACQVCAVQVRFVVHRSMPEGRGELQAAAMSALGSAGAA